MTGARAAGARAAGSPARHRASELRRGHRTYPQNPTNATPRRAESAHPPERGAWVGLDGSVGASIRGHGGLDRRRGWTTAVARRARSLALTGIAGAGSERASSLLLASRRVHGLGCRADHAASAPESPHAPSPFTMRLRNALLSGRSWSCCSRAPPRWRSPHGGSSPSRPRSARRAPAAARRRR